MERVLAIIFLVGLTLGIMKMVFDVQISKLEKLTKELKDMLDEN